MMKEKLSRSEIAKGLWQDPKFRMRVCNSLKGRKVWNKGKSWDEDTRTKISLSNKGKVAWNKGLRTGLIPKTAFKKGYKPSKEVLLKKSGENHFRWKGGIWKNNQKEYWRRAHLARIARKKGASGSHTLPEWESLKMKFRYMCLCCKRREPEITLTEDHIMPLSKGGLDSIENIQPLCLSCNSRKNVKIINYMTLNLANT